MVKKKILGKSIKRWKLGDKHLKWDEKKQQVNIEQEGKTLDRKKKKKAWQQTKTIKPTRIFKQKTFKIYPSIIRIIKGEIILKYNNIWLEEYWWLVGRVWEGVRWQISWCGGCQHTAGHQPHNNHRKSFTMFYSGPDDEDDEDFTPTSTAG